MTKSLLKFASPAVISSLLLSVCAEALTTPSSSPAGSAPASSVTGGATTGSGDLKVYMVSGFGSFDDKPFNEISYKGLLRTKEQLGVETAQVESKEGSKYVYNVRSMINVRCSVIVTVGFVLTNATEAAAEQNPSVRFAIVDNESFEGVDNMREPIFGTAQPASMAGHVATSLGQTGEVGTFGGIDYPTVRIFVDGFAQGVEYYSKAKGKSVQALGWDRATRDGQFIGGTGPFSDNAGDKNTVDTFIAQGTDIILPVTGPSRLGALVAVKETNGKMNAIQIDTDGYVPAPKCKDVIITSIEESMDVAILNVIKTAKEGSFSSDPYTGTLKNEGVDPFGFHDLDSKVSAETRSKLEQIRADIISGKITVKITVRWRANSLKRGTLGYPFSGDRLWSEPAW